MAHHSDKRGKSDVSFGSKAVFCDWLLLAERCPSWLAEIGQKRPIMLWQQASSLKIDDIYELWRFILRLALLRDFRSKFS
ncbi:hypothetical protein ACUDWF_001391 [Pseudomonas aeruginosa]